MVGADEPEAGQEQVKGSLPDQGAKLVKDSRPDRQGKPMSLRPSSRWEGHGVLN